MGASERFDLSGKTALVTGGSRGIGRGIAVALAEHGADVAIVYRSAQKQADEVAEQITGMGRKSWVYQQDLGEVEKLAGLATTIWDDAGKIDVLVNNAGVGFLDPFNQITLERWRRVFAINLDACFVLAQTLAERMIAAGIKGRIINVSSVNGFVAEAGLAHYNASKGGLELLSQSLAIELGQHGITVNTVCPGMIETEIGEDMDNLDMKDFLDYFREHVPLEHRLGRVEDCVGAVVFLAAPAGSYITGQHIVMDGGILCEQVPRLKFMPPYRNTK